MTHVLARYDALVAAGELRRDADQAAAQPAAAEPVSAAAAQPVADAAQPVASSSTEPVSSSVGPPTHSLRIRSVSS